MSEMNRRTFLQGCSAAIMAMAGARLHSIALGSPNAGSNEILINVFLRGGCDVLNLIPPIGGADRGYYEAARPDLRVPVAEALQLGGSAFGLHPAAAALHEIYGDGKLAIVQATGMYQDTRSHFVAQNFMDMGTPGDDTTTSGWISRHLETMTLPDDARVPVLAAGNSAPRSVLGMGNVLTLDGSSSFSLNTGPWRWRSQQQESLRTLYQNGSTQLHQAGLETLETASYVESILSDTYVPDGGAVYPSNTFANKLKLIAQMVKADVGLQTATIDLGGWDTHNNQGTGSTGYFNTIIDTLSSSLGAFFVDLNSSSSESYIDRVTVVVMSEFGRRLRQNEDNGTDHGHGGAMLVLGGQVNGGLYGTWPGLHTDQLYNNGDLEVTTDYRQVLSEILIRRFENPKLGVIFPQYRDYQPLGIVQGSDIPVDYSTDLQRVYIPFAGQ